MMMTTLKSFKGKSNCAAVTEDTLMLYVGHTTVYHARDNGECRALFYSDGRACAIVEDEKKKNALKLVAWNRDDYYEQTVEQFSVMENNREYGFDSIHGVLAIPCFVRADFDETKRQTTKKVALHRILTGETEILTIADTCFMGGTPRMVKFCGDGESSLLVHVDRNDPGYYVVKVDYRDPAHPVTTATYAIRSGSDLKHMEDVGGDGWVFMAGGNWAYVAKTGLEDQDFALDGGRVIHVGGRTVVVQAEDGAYTVNRLVYDDGKWSMETRTKLDVCKHMSSRAKFCCISGDAIYFRLDSEVYAIDLDDGHRFKKNFDFKSEVRAMVMAENN